MSNNTVAPAKRTSWFGITFWVVVGGLLLLEMALFSEYFDPLTIQQCLFRLDFRYWFPSLACPLWLIFVFLAVDAMAFRQYPTKIGRGRRIFEIVVLVIKAGLVLWIAYLFFDMFHAPTRRPLRLLWYAANVPLFMFFAKKWLLLYKTRTQANLTREETHLRVTFLIMSLTLTVELSLCNLLLAMDWDRFFSYPLWRWFSFGDYSHWAAAAFILICLVTGLALFVLKEWLAAIRQAQRVNVITDHPQQSE